MGTTILVGPPGTGLSAAARKLGSVGAATISDVESLMLDSLTPKQHQRLSSFGAAGNCGMQSFMRAFTRQESLALWAQAFEKALQKFDEGAQNNYVIACHLHLYRDDRSEFYSTLGPVIKLLSKTGFKIDRVIVLIDDVFDMLSRLGGIDAALSEELRFSKYRDITARSLPDNLHIDEFNAELSVDTSVLSLVTALQWRRAEMLAAESLASATDSSVVALGVKHPFESLKMLVAGHPHTQTVYISHPITDPRVQLSRELVHDTSATWAPIVTECNKLPAILRSIGVVGIMPTAIDEYRFDRLSTEAQSIYDAPLTLSARWELMRDGDELIAPTDSAKAQHREILSRGSVFTLPVAAGAARRSLEAAIWSEVPFRDHFLVSHSDHLLVFRPLFGSQFSDGVRREVEHWRDLVTAGDKAKRAAFVHFASDIEAKLSLLSMSQDIFKKENIIRAIDWLKTEKGLSRSEAQKLLNGESIGQTLLGGRSDLSTPAQVEAALERTWSCALDEALFEALTLLPDVAVARYCRVFIIDRANGTDRSSLRDVLEFLDTGNSHHGKNHWLVDPSGVINRNIDYYTPAHQP